MRIRALVWLVAGLMATGLLAACANDDEPAEPAADGAAEETTATDAGIATVMTADSDLGEILVDADGNTLYLFDADTGEESTCYDDCEQDWPPLEPIEEPVAGEGADQSLLGTTERTDGTTQVTYAGHPLYFFSGDEAPGDTNGQKLGDVWWVVDPAGASIKKASNGEGGRY